MKMIEDYDATDSKALPLVLDKRRERESPLPPLNQVALEQEGAVVRDGEHVVALSNVAAANLDAPADVRIRLRADERPHGFCHTVRGLHLDGDKPCPRPHEEVLFER